MHSADPNGNSSSTKEMGLKKYTITFTCQEKKEEDHAKPHSAPIYRRDRAILSPLVDRLRDFFGGKNGMGNKLQAVKNMVKVIMTPAPDLDKYEKEMGFPTFKDMQFSFESKEWHQEHHV